MQGDPLTPSVVNIKSIFITIVVHVKKNNPKNPRSFTDGIINLLKED